MRTLLQKGEGVRLSKKASDDRLFRYIIGKELNLYALSYDRTLLIEGNKSVQVPGSARRQVMIGRLRYVIGEGIELSYDRILL